MVGKTLVLEVLVEGETDFVSIQIPVWMQDEAAVRRDLGKQARREPSKAFLLMNGRTVCMGTIEFLPPDQAREKQRRKNAEAKKRAALQNGYRQSYPELDPLFEAMNKCRDQSQHAE